MPGLGMATTVGALLAVVVLGGCSANGPQSDVPRAKEPHVVMPGAPGDEPRAATSAELEDIRTSPRVTDADLNYVRMMIPHHEQAVLMSDLAKQRAEDPEVRALADRIGRAQAPEIEGMRGWLDSHASGPGGHDHGAHAEHGGMPGMATPEQLDRLRAATGREFDRLFLRLMIAHHEGAVTMATDVLKQTTNEQLHGMAQDVLVGQNDEVGAMSGMLARLGG